MSIFVGYTVVYLSSCTNIYLKYKLSISDTKPVILAEDNGMTSTPKVSDTVKITKKREQNRRKTIESRNELENVVKRNPNTKKACDDQFPVGMCFIY